MTPYNIFFTKIIKKRDCNVKALQSLLFLIASFKKATFFSALGLALTLFLFLQPFGNSLALVHYFGECATAYPS